VEAVAWGQLDRLHDLTDNVGYRLGQRHNSFPQSGIGAAYVSLPVWQEQNLLRSARIHSVSAALRGTSVHEMLYSVR